MPIYRNPTDREIQLLEQQHNRIENPKNLYITNKTDLTRVINVQFSGVNRLGAIKGEVASYGGVSRKKGIYHAHLHNCTIGDNPFISGVKNYLANYHIGNNVVIENVDVVATEKGATFGNGISVEVINEGGGRAIPIFDHMSAQVAYLLALYRYKKSFVEKLSNMVYSYVDSIRSDRGTIGDCVTIQNTGLLRDMKIGSGTTILGSSKLVNGSIHATKESPVYIGVGVVAENFIVCSDSTIDNASIISNCFIGQGCTFDKHYSAEHSVFFANSQGFHGEACSIFAGPYTVTHHKSTLLIAGMFSFMNAGSGSNQSNHMYKLGPIHQGVMERGAKTASDSYLLWPSLVGAFTLVMGRHSNNSDSSDLPFSYLIESKGESYLAPGVNLKSVGTVRDAQKWPLRDNRKGENKQDCINFNLLSPFTILKMHRGIQILEKLQRVSGAHTREYTYNGMKIELHALKRGIELYKLGIHKFLGNSLISRLQQYGIAVDGIQGKKQNRWTQEDIQKALQIDTQIGLGKWVDIGGMLAPESCLQELIQTVEVEEFSSIKEVQQRCGEIHSQYYSYEWTWAAWLIEEFYHKDVSQCTPEDIIEIVEQWKKSVIALDEALYMDAKKEFAMDRQVGFGADGMVQERQQDFLHVRGEFLTNSTVQEIQNHIKRKTDLGDRIITVMQSITD